MSQPLGMALLSPDVRAYLRERYEQWRTALPWYRRAPEPTEEAPLYLALERLIRELRAELANERERWAPAVKAAFRDAEDLLDHLGDRNEEAFRLRAENVALKEALASARIAALPVDGDADVVAARAETERLRHAIAEALRLLGSGHSVERHLRGAIRGATETQGL